MVKSKTCLLFNLFPEPFLSKNAHIYLKNYFKKCILKIMPETSPNLEEEWTSTCSVLKRSHVESIQRMLH